MNYNKLTTVFVASTALLALLFSAGAAAESDWRRPWGVNLPEGVTSLSQVAYSMHMLTFWIVTVIGIGVFAGVFYSVWRFRKSQGAKPATWHHSTAVEIVWTAVPFLILLGIAIPATQAMIKMEDTGNYDMTIKVTGYQWMWEYEYLDEDIQFFSRLDRDSDRARQRNSDLRPRDVEHYLLNVDNPLVVPVNTKIRFLLTANDVIHSWWVPELGWKKDTIPGFINEAWADIQKPGTYRGQCAELCGRDHGFMPIVVVAKTQEDYEAWVAEQTEDSNGDVAVDEDDLSDMDMDDLMAVGGNVYDNQCMACHQAGGEGMGDMFPALVGSDKVLGDRDAYKSVLIDGISGTTMQSFANLSNQELAGVLTYVRNAWGNDEDGGDEFQPADVEAAR